MSGTQDRPAKRARLLDEDESGYSDGEGGALLQNGDASTLKVNSEYARRFEHNKKREELHRLEEKYKVEGSDSESTSEDEDDAGDLATLELDGEINATLKALKSKDPRIYDKSATFFRPIEENGQSVAKKEKTMHLSDYHRQNLLRVADGNLEEEDQSIPPTYSEEQDTIRQQLVREMHGAPDESSTNADAMDNEDDFMVKKSKPVHDAIDVDQSQQQNLKDLNVEDADKDPETYLNNFLAARAWVPDENSRFAHLDSDDSGDEHRADLFEEAYNMRFEDPETANAKLMSYARETAKFSARREEKSGRQRQREREKEIKDAAKKERHEEKKRLRKLKVEQMERKVAQIKEAAGLGESEVVDLDEWRNVLEGDFEDDQWEAEMQRRFGDKYYAEKDAVDAAQGDEVMANGKKGKNKKPKWEDDIDINDLVPDFDEEDTGGKPAFTLTDDEQDGLSDQDGEPEQDGDAAMTNGTEAGGNDTAEPQKSRKELQAEARSAKRRQRMAIEELVDASLSTTLPGPNNNKAAGPSSSSSGSTTAFRYRETSPSDFGLSARDILFADDGALNSFAGLKKTHAFRDEAKKARDRKKLGKKARLREWRRDTFGDERGYGGSFAEFVRAKTGAAANGGASGVNAARRETDGEAGAGEKKRKRKGKSKSKGKGAIPI